LGQQQWDRGAWKARAGLPCSCTTNCISLDFLSFVLQDVGVQYILDAVVAALAANKDRKFVYAEMVRRWQRGCARVAFRGHPFIPRPRLPALQAFFTRWWRQQEEDVQDLVRELVHSGQLSFVNGGYVQHDEAAAHFVAMLDQTTLGHGYRGAAAWKGVFDTGSGDRRIRDDGVDWFSLV
jgi:Glycosyl hydrolases family 38 N-terminal domain